MALTSASAGLLAIALGRVRARDPEAVVAPAGATRAVGASEAAPVVPAASPATSAPAAEASSATSARAAEAASATSAPAAEAA
jgi:hypothetical protein